MDTKALVLIGMMILMPAPEALAKNHGFDKNYFYKKVVSKYQSRKSAKVNHLRSIQVGINDIKASLAEIKDDVAVLNEEIDASGAALSALADELSQVTEVPAGLLQDVADARARHEADVETIDELVALIDDEIIELAMDASALSSDLEGAIDDMIDAVDSRRTSSAGPALEVITVNAVLTSINTSIHGLNADIRRLKSTINAQSAQLELIDLRLEVLNEQEFVAVQSVTFETLNTKCGTEQRTFDYSVNGQVVASTEGDSASTCSCAAPVTTTDANLAGISFAGDGTDVFGIESSASPMHLVAWSRATVVDGEGNTMSYCLFDQSGGDCAEVDLCVAGYTEGAIDASLNF